MPKLPDARAIEGHQWRVGGSFVPQVGRPPLISRAGGLEAIGKAVASAGANIARGMEELAAGIKRRQGEQSEIEKLQAEVQATRAINDLYEQELNSDDYKGATDRYRAGAQQIIENVANSISDPRERAKFIAQNQLRSESGAERISNQTYRRARYDAISEDTSALQKLADEAVRDPDHAVEYFREIFQRVEGMRERFHMTPMEADTLRKKYGSDIAKGLMELELQRDPEAVLERLKKWGARGMEVPAAVPEQQEEERDVPLKPFVPGEDEQSQADEPGAQFAQPQFGDQPIRQASLDPSIGLGGGGARGGIDVPEGADLGGPQQIGGVHSLGEQRQIAFKRDVADPRVLQLLAANIEAEVGGEGHNAKLGYLETVMNRALSRGYSLEDSMWKYGASITHDKMRAGKFTEAGVAETQDLIKLALEGSNIANYATGNESGPGHIKGTSDSDIAVNFGVGKERLVWEVPDRNWINRMKSYGGSNMPLGGASSPVRMRSDDINWLESRGGHPQGKDAPPFSSEMAARLRAAGEAYEQETGRKAVFGEMSRDVATQAVYYERYKAGTGGIAAAPGQSRHNRGLATDIPSGAFLDWMHQNGNRYGIIFRVRGDPVHAELAPDTQRVALPFESGSSGPVRIASLEYPDGMWRAQLGTSIGSLFVPRQQPPRTIADSPAQRVADASRPPASRQEAYVRAIQAGQRGTYTDPHTGQTVVSRQVAQNVNKETGNTAASTAVERPSGYPQNIGKYPKGMIQFGNLDLDNRPVVRLPDGNIATVRSMSFNLDGKEVLLPTISQDGRLLTPKQALEEYRKTGRYLGVFDTPEHADAYAKAVHEAQQQRYSTNPDVSHENPRLPIDPDKFQIPPPKRRGEPGFDGLLDIMRPQDVLSIARGVKSALAKDYAIPPSVSHKNWLALNDGIEKGDISAADFSRVEKAYQAGASGDREHGINHADYVDLKQRVNEAAKAQRATYNNMKQEYMAREGNRYITQEEPAITAEQAQRMTADDFEKYQQRQARVTPEQKADADSRLYRFSKDIDRKAAQIIANGGDPTVLFQPGTIDKPNPWYIGRRADGSDAPIDMYANPTIMGWVRRGYLDMPPQLDPTAQVKPGVIPPWRRPGETAEGFRNRKLRGGDLPTGPDPWRSPEGGGLPFHYAPTDPAALEQLGPVGKTPLQKQQEQEQQRRELEELQQERRKQFGPQGPGQPDQTTPDQPYYGRERPQQPATPPPPLIRGDVPNTILGGMQMADVYRPSFEQGAADEEAAV